MFASRLTVPFRLVLAIFAAAAFFAPSAALAHSVGDTSAGFLSGLKHPVLGPDHLAAMVAVGLWGAQLGRPLVIALPIAFPLVMALGAALGIAGAPLPAVEIGIAASALVLGLVVLFAIKAPTWLAVALVGAFALFHGHAHGTELPHAASALAYGVGFMIATGLLHLAGIMIGLLNHQGAFGSAAVRAGGGVIALGGAYFLAGAAGVM